MKIIVTGGAGFVGSNLISFLNRNGEKDIVIVDSINNKNKIKYLLNLDFSDFIDYKNEITFLKQKINRIDIKAIFHVGALTDVLEKDISLFLEYNYEHSKFWLETAIRKSVPFFYLSSSAVYGNSGCFSVSRNCEKPLNEYAFSKWMFDNYIRKLLQDGISTKVIGFRLFNVFGLNEYHKDKNASIPYRFFRFLKDNGCIELFEDEITRDYIHVEDVCKVLYNTYKHNLLENGIYNLGSGKPISHKEIANLVVNKFKFHKIMPNTHYENFIRLVPIPVTLRERFQFFTEAKDIPEPVLPFINDPITEMANYLDKLILREITGGI